MSEEAVSVSIDLDSKEFLEKAKHAYEAIGEIGESEGILKLAAQMGEVAAGVGIVGLALLALKTSFDLVLDAEKIKQVNTTFENLAKNAGLVGEELKEGMIKASGGLIEENELLQIANRSLIEMGSSAGKLPQLMEVARKATAAFGGDLAGNFEKINQAIATGQTRGLRHLGILVDQNKAYREYAHSIGVADDSLSKAGQSQAIMNAVLEKGKTAFSGVAVGAREAQDSWTSTKVAFSEMKESFVLFFDSVFGKSVVNAIHVLRELTNGVKTLSMAAFGNEHQKAEVHVKALKDSIDATTKRLQYYQDVLNKEGPNARGGLIAKGFETQKERLKELTEQLEKYEHKLEAAEGPKEKPKATPDAQKQVDPVEQEKLKQNKAKFEQDMLAFHKERLALEVKDEQSLVAVAKHVADEKVIIEQEATHKIEAVKNSHVLNESQKAQEIVQIEKLKNQRIAAADLDLEKRRLQALDLYLKRSDSVAQGMSRGFEVHSAKAKIALADFGARGAASADGLSKGLGKAFVDMGSGAQSATDAMKGMFLNLIADRAEAEGALLLASGLWPPNPIALGAGAALMALGGALRSQSGGGGGGGASSSASGGSSAGGATNGGYSTSGYADGSKPPMSTTQATQQGVTINVQGHYLETDETRQMITKLVRESADATDFKISGGN